MFCINFHNPHWPAGLPTIIYNGNNVSTTIISTGPCFIIPATAFRNPLLELSSVIENGSCVLQSFPSNRVCTTLQTSPNPSLPISIADPAYHSLPKNNTALSLGQRCEYDASCKFLDKYSECAKDEQRCRCIHNYSPKVNLTHGTSCVQSR